MPSNEIQPQKPSSNSSGKTSGKPAAASISAPATATQTPRTKIQFKPLHEGMGFHPFSDGLPYAPESKAKYATGTGATTAGRPQFSSSTAKAAAQAGSAKITTKNVAANVPMSVSTGSSMGANKPLGTARQLQGQNPLQNQAVSAPNPFPSALQASLKASASISRQEVSIAATLAPSAHASGHAEPTLEASVLRRRFFAYLMDTFIHAGFWLATNLTALFFFKFQIDSEILRDNSTQFVIFFLLSQWMFIALQETLFENSIGKVFFNLEFKRTHGSLLLRSVVFMLGALCFGIGIFQRWQDKFGQIQLKTKIYGS